MPYRIISNRWSNCDSRTAFRESQSRFRQFRVARSRRRIVLCVFPHRASLSGGITRVRISGVPNEVSRGPASLISTAVINAAQLLLGTFVSRLNLPRKWPTSLFSRSQCVAHITAYHREERERKRERTVNDCRTDCNGRQLRYVFIAVRLHYPSRGE